jgi:hypothetical protein
MTEHVQHARTVRQGRHAIPVEPLVENQPSSVRPGIDRERTACTTSALASVPDTSATLSGNPSDGAQRIVARNDGAQRQQEVSASTIVASAVHSGGIRLQHGNIVVAVDHQSGSRSASACTRR